MQTREEVEGDVGATGGGLLGVRQTDGRAQDRA